jgi:hypothetical protein
MVYSQKKWAILEISSAKGVLLMWRRLAYNSNHNLQ